MKKLFAVGVCLLGAGLLAGCETASRPPVALPISVMAPTASASGLDAGQTPAQALTVTATVNNDSSNKGVTWMCTFTPSGGTAAACANFPSTTTNCSACMATFTAPASPGSVSITAASIADSTKSSPALSFKVNAPPTFPAASQVATQLQTSSPSCNASSPGGTVTLGPTAGRQYSCGFAAALLGGTPPFTWSAPGLPAGLTINSSTGVISGTPTSVTKLRSGGSVAGRLTASSDPMVTVTATDSSPNKVLMSINIAINVALGFTNVVVPSSGTAGQAYTGTATVGGGTTPYHWTVSGLPTGLTSNAATATTTVTISGTPTQSGTFMVTISVTDSAASPATVSTTITLTIAPPPPLTITTTSLPTADVNLPYNATLQATGGIPPDTWSAGAGTLPAGLMLSPAGQISGTPTMAGTFGFIVQVVDSETPSMMATKSVSIMINPQLAVTTTTLPDGTVGTAYSTTLASNGGTPPVTWAVTTGTLPASLSLNSTTGVISGTPTTAGTSAFSVTAMDHLNQTATQSLSITIHPAPLSITTTTLPNGTVGTSYSQQLAASGGIPPDTWALATGSNPLPAGLTLSAGGLIAGTPTTPTGTFTFTVQVTDSETPTAMTATKTFTLTINAAVACTLGGSESLLTGQFVAVMRGHNSGGPEGIGLMFDADGNGGVAKGGVGIEDTNRTGASGGVQQNLPIDATQSCYSVGSDHRGLLIIVTPSGTQTFRFSLGSVVSSVATNGHIIEFDTTGSVVAGVLRKQDTTVFNTASFSGNNFAFGASGDDFGVVGALSGQNTGVTGLLDFNASGFRDNNSTLTDFTATSAVSFTGSYTIGSNGRGTFTFTFTPAGIVTGVSGILYAVSSSELLLMDSAMQSQTSPLFVGKVLKQSKTSFSEADLNATSVAYTSETSRVVAGGTRTDLLIVTPNGMGGASGTLIENDAGTTLTSASSSTITYSVTNSQGRVLVSGTGKHNAALYLVSPNEGFIVDADGQVGKGFLEPQSGSPFSAASAKSPPSYAFGTFQPEVAGVDLEEGVTNFNGLSAITGTSDDNSTGGGGSLNASNSISATYSIDSTGTGFIPQTGMICASLADFSAGRCNLIFVVIAPPSSISPFGKVVLMDAKPVSGTSNVDPSLRIGEQ